MANTIKIKRSTVAGNAPSASDLEVGELAINTADAKLYTKHGSSVVDLSDFASSSHTHSYLPTSGGTMTGNLNLGDNVKAIFGGELEIYSDATHARIKENGSGQLKIQGNNMQLLTSDGSATYLEGNASTSAVTLYHASNSPRLATTSTGIDVTGTVTADGLTVDGSTTLTGDTDVLTLATSTHGGSVELVFQTDINAPYQLGRITHSHIDGYGSGAYFTLGSTESTTTILADGKLMYKEGIYSKPSSGTGAGTRKDANWDTAYGWGNHASAGYASSSHSHSEYASSSHSHSEYASSSHSHSYLPLSGGTLTGGLTGTSGTFSGTMDVNRLQLRDMGDFITFYGTSATEHSISSRDASGDAADDLRINSYGALYINLDSNNNNSSGASFKIGRHGGATGTISDDLFAVDGQNGNVKITGSLNYETISADGQNDITLFGANQGAAQAGAFHNKLEIKGGFSQTRNLELYQVDSGYATIGTSWTGNYLDIHSNFERVRFNQKAYIGTTQLWNDSGVINSALYTNTTYSVGDGGLTQKNFTTTLKNKLDGIATSANNYSHPTGNGNNHIPVNGSSGQYLKWSGTSGTATWTTPDFASSSHTHSYYLLKAGGTMTGELQVNARLDVGTGSANDTEIRIYKADNNVSDHIQFYNGTTRVGEIGCEDTSWLRINQQTAKNIYTPRYIRADGGFFVDGASKGINGSGNFVNGTITGATDANVSNWDTAYGWGNHASEGYLANNATGTSGFSTGGGVSAGDYAVSLGPSANADGGYSVAIGMLANTDDTGSVSIGWAAGNSSENGNNVSVGEKAGSSLTGTGSNGSKNTLIGRWAGRSVSTGKHNVMIGNEAGYDFNDINTGYDNTFVGHIATGADDWSSPSNDGSIFKATAIGSNTASNDYGTAVGFYSGATGTHSTAIGNEAKAFGQNTTAIGNGADAEGEAVVATYYMSTLTTGTMGLDNYWAMSTSSSLINQEPDDISKTSTLSSSVQQILFMNEGVNSLTDAGTVEAKASALQGKIAMTAVENGDKLRLTLKPTSGSGEITAESTVTFSITGKPVYHFDSSTTTWPDAGDTDEVWRVPVSVTSSDINNLSGVSDGSVVLYTGMSGTNRIVKIEIIKSGINDSIALGNSNVTKLICNTNVISSLSDERDKADIKDLSEHDGLPFINKLKPRTFYWDRREWYENGIPDGSKKVMEYNPKIPNSGKKMGFIAQETEEAIGESKCLSESNLVTKHFNKKSMANAELIAPMIKAIQQLSEENDKLKARLDVLENTT